MEFDDFNCYDGVLHLDKNKQDQIWVNIGTEFGAEVQLTMGYGKMSEDGFYEDYVSFDMDTAEEVDQLIAMLNEAKTLLASYHEEFGLNETKEEEQS